ncbi:MAG TPA: BfmA/BtgA family mobilization protein [Mucilaginibacter sp.]
MEDINIKNIRFPVETDNRLIKLAERFGRTKLDLFKQMVDYFYRTKKDPLDTNDELLKAAIGKNYHSLTGFVKTQEKELLVPMRVEIDRMISSQKKILDCFNTQILQHNKQQTELLKQVAQTLQAKEQLKTKFGYILEQYIKAREQPGLSITAKEELIKKAKEQLKLI